VRDNTAHPEMMKLRLRVHDEDFEKSAACTDLISCIASATFKKIAHGNPRKFLLPMKNLSHQDVWSTTRDHLMTCASSNGKTDRTTNQLSPFAWQKN
jgi:hypothetical protein